MVKKYPYNPDYAVPPGRTLHETLDEMGIDATVLVAASSTYFQDGCIT